MFLWFIKKFMKNSYKKYLEELDEFNHLKMEIIKNCDYYNKVGTTQYHFQFFNSQSPDSHPQPTEVPTCSALPYTDPDRTLRR